VAFTRAGSAAVVVPRLTALRDGWEATTVELPDGRWVDRLAGGEMADGSIEAARLLGRFPVALLARRDA
jgi:(1->4)-alpha-D-glucan 1-alpha-D-glucosylmutase